MKKLIMLASPYGYMQTGFANCRIANGTIGIVNKDGQVEFECWPENMTVPKHWQRAPDREHVTRGAFDPMVATAELKAAGFKFLSEVCPIKFAGKHYVERQPDGALRWLQWDV